MRRGLIARSRIELPDAALDARVARMRAALGEAGLDALVVYTNNTQPAAVSWLTGFVPYWSEALFVLPREGEPRLVVALSYRVKSWIERTSRVADVVHTPRIGIEAAPIIAGVKTDAAVGIVDRDALYSGIFADLAEGGPRLVFSDASDLFVKVRNQVDPAEVALTFKATEIARRALAAMPKDRSSLGTIVAAIEAEARGLGAEEIYIAAAPDLARDQRLVRIEGEAKLGDSFAIRATVAYKGYWMRLGRSYFRKRVPENMMAQANEQFGTAIANLPNKLAFEKFSSWLVEGCRLMQPLAPLMGSRMTDARLPAPGAFVSVQARIEIKGRAIFLCAPAMIGEHGESASLLIDPMSD